METSILKLREEIDEIDLQILRLLNERVTIVLRIQKVKSILKLCPYSMSRESEIIQRLCEANEGPLSDAAVKDIFCRILLQCLASSKVNEE